LAALPCLNWIACFYQLIARIFIHTSKKFEGVSPKKILEKKNVFPKKYVELRTFDGNAILLSAKGTTYFQMELGNFRSTGYSRLESLELVISFSKVYI
jgi:hypothetical protein